MADLINGQTDEALIAEAERVAAMALGAVSYPVGGLIALLASRLKALSSLPPGSGEAEGWVLVPREPTEEMNLRGRNTVPGDALCEADVEDLWSAMLASAGRPPK